jgi:Putative beta-barrel porin-2, OmpL-like. bbp2
MRSQRIVTAQTQPTVYALATSLDGMRVALTTGVPLARGRRARLVVLVPQIVPYPLPVDSPAEATAFTKRRYRELVHEAHGEAEIRVCLCRTPRDVLQLLPAASTVVVGGRVGPAWPSLEERLSRHLIRLGHHAVLAASGRTWSSAALGGALAVVLSFFGVRPAAAGQGAVQAEPQTPAAPQSGHWDYGAFADVGYLHDFNDPSNHLFRSRGTAFHVNEWDLNMAGAYLKRKATEQSRWGTEILIQGGKDEEVFGFSATAPNLTGADALGHFGLANVSYLAPVGTGLTIQGGIFASFIGYDSLYAKDNMNYTRPWGADFTPYLMTGVNASYAVSDKATATGFVVNGYWHLADANNVPSLGGQFAYKASPRVTVKQTVLAGPHQTNTELSRWRVLSDTIVERRGDRITAAFEAQLSTETVDATGNPRASWISAQAPVRWAPPGRWSVSIRPEVARDSAGRWTGAEQSIVAVTTTLEYRRSYQWASAILRLEHRFDDSRGPGGGFFDDGEVSPGVVALKPTQHLLILGLMLTFDSPSSR